jgi:hypothetical protein
MLCRLQRTFLWAALGLLALGVAGCKVEVDEDPVEDAAEEVGDAIEEASDEGG